MQLSSDKSNPKIPSCLAHRLKSFRAERVNTASIIFIGAPNGLRSITEQEPCRRKITALLVYSAKQDVNSVQVQVRDCFISQSRNRVVTSPTIQRQRLSTASNSSSRYGWGPRNVAERLRGFIQLISRRLTALPDGYELNIRANARPSARKMLYCAIGSGG